MEYAGSFHHEVPGEHERRSWLGMAERAWNFFLYSSLFLATAAFAMAYVSCLVNAVPFTAPVGLLLGLVVFSVYNLNRRTDEAEDALNHASRFEVTSTHSRSLLILALAAYGVALCFAALSGIPTVLVASVPLLAGVFYSAPLLPKRTGYRRLKEIPVCKNLVVSFAWGFTFSLIPVTTHGISPGSASAVAFLFIFSWTFIASVLPDIRDRGGDAATGVRTIPVILGVHRTRTLLTLFNILSGILLLLMGAGQLSLAIMVVIFFSLLYSEVCILRITRGGNDDLLCDLVSDGQFLAVALAGCIITGQCPQLLLLFPG